MDKYADEGITDIESIEVLRLKPFDSVGLPTEIINEFGSKGNYWLAVKEFEMAFFTTA